MHQTGYVPLAERTMDLGLEGLGRQIEASLVCRSLPSDLSVRPYQDQAQLNQTEAGHLTPWILYHARVQACQTARADTHPTQVVRYRIQMIEAQHHQTSLLHGLAQALITRMTTMVVEHRRRLWARPSQESLRKEAECLLCQDPNIKPQLAGIPKDLLHLMVVTYRGA